MKRILKEQSAFFNLRVLIGLFIPLLGVAFTSHNTHADCVQPPPNMVAWWPGDNNTTDIIGGHTGALTGDATFGSGIDPMKMKMLRLAAETSRLGRSADRSPIRDIRVIRGSEGFWIFPSNLAPGFTHYLRERPEMGSHPREFEKGRNNERKLLL